MSKVRQNSDRQHKRSKTGTKQPAVSTEWGDVFQAIGQPSFILTPNFRIIACNKAVADLTGKPAEYFIGKKCCEVLHGTKKPPKDCPMEKLRKSGRFETAEMEVETLDRTFLVACTPVFNKAGNLQRIIHIANDITVYKQMERKITEGEEIFRILLENLPDGVFAHDLDGRIIQANKMACTMTGYTREELTSMKIADLDEESITRKDRETIWNRLKKGDSFLLVNATHRRKDGSQYPAEIRINSVTLNNKPVMLGLVQDVTERKRVEEKLRLYQEKLKSLSAELSYAEERERRRIAIGIHDNIGQKLAMAKLNLQFIKDSPLNRKAMSAIDNACGMMDEMIEDAHSLIFNLSNPILYEVGLEDAIHSFMKNEIQDNGGPNCEFVSSGGKINLDDDTKVVLFKAVRELLVNTFKHAEAENIKVGFSQHGNEVEITVEDDGAGFDVSKLGMPSGKKGGFGLFNIREKIEYMGGCFKIESRPGKGTRIFITAPLKKTERGWEEVKLHEDTDSR
jgi:PAS domain S-box-containing protein